MHTWYRTSRSRFDQQSSVNEENPPRSRSLFVLFCELKINEIQLCINSESVHSLNVGAQTKSGTFLPRVKLFETGTNRKRGLLPVLYALMLIRNINGPSSRIR